MDVKLIPAKIVELLERNGALKFDELSQEDQEDIQWIYRG